VDIKILEQMKKQASERGNYKEVIRISKAIEFNKVLEENIVSNKVVRTDRDLAISRAKAYQECINATINAGLDEHLNEEYEHNIILIKKFFNLTDEEIKV